MSFRRTVHIISCFSFFFFFLQLFYCYLYFIPIRKSSFIRPIFNLISLCSQFLYWYITRTPNFISYQSNLILQNLPRLMSIQKKYFFILSFKSFFLASIFIFRIVCFLTLKVLLVSWSYFCLLYRKLIKI